MSIAGETPRAIFQNPFCDPALVALAIETGLLPRDEDEQSLLSDIEISVDDSLPDPAYSASESDDDDASTYTYHSRLLQTRSSLMAPTFAKSIRSSNNKSPPTLTAGKVNPDVLKTWERGCVAYFGQRKVTAGDQVRQVLDSFDDTRTINWVGHRREELAKMNFPDFMNLFRKHALDSDWHLDLKKKLQRRTQGEEEAFEDFANEVCALNTLLVDAPKSSFTHERLHEILLAGAHDDINELYIASELPDKYAAAEWGNLELDVLNDWIIDMVKIDKRVTNERKRARRLIEERNRRSKNGGAGNEYKKTSSENKENTGGRVWIPALTKDERDVLRDHHGCFKCRKYYTDHVQKDCKAGFPKEHVVCTNAAATAARPAGWNTPKRKTLPVGAVVGSSVIYESDSEDSKGSGSGSGSEDDELNDDVSDPVPSSHLLFHGFVDGQDEFQTRVLLMIDHGCPLVMIDDRTATKLGLKRRQAATPYPITPAFGCDTSSQELYDWVRFDVSSIDNSWTSRAVKAVCIKDLCCDVILGLPFLESNRIVVDAHARSAVTNDGYDLMKNVPRVIKRPKLCPSVKKRRLDAFVSFCDKKATLFEEFRKKIPIIEGSEVTNEHIAAAILATTERLTWEKEFQALREEFNDVFQPPPHVEELPDDIHAEILLKDANMTIETRTYSCPRKYRDAWKKLLDEHEAAGRIRPSSSPYASPSFIIPKADPNAPPRWVNDYRQLNANCVPDRNPLPRVDDILADCGKGRYFTVMDMTNAFFQTKMKPEHIPLTAVTTPFGLYEFVVMPMGFRNAPAIHQRRVSRALKQYIGKFCHVYLDDIIIWSDSVEEHLRHVRLVLEALREHKLYLNPKKCKFMQTSINFLGHIISSDGIRPDGSKIEKIVSWPVPNSSTDVRKFLGLVRYLAAFLPSLAEHTMVLNTLTTKECDKKFPAWAEDHQSAFDAIKQLVISPECLTVINHANPENNKIFVTTDASDYRIGAVLSYGPSWETARPVAFDSVPLRGAELNYPVHEKELLAIVTALKKWRADLLGAEFFIYTDHRTLENFHRQREFSRRQARWMEYMSQFEGRIVYVKGEDNTVADALSRLPTTTQTAEAEELSRQVFEEKFAEDDAERPFKAYPVCVLLAVDRANTVCAITDLLKTRRSAAPATLQLKDITMNGEFVELVKKGYAVDPWCQKFESAARGMSSFRNESGLWFVNDRLIIPNFQNLRGILFQLAHDKLGHFGFKKAYAALRDDYYWPNMRTDLEVGYIPACEDCARNKDATKRTAGPLHPLPVPDGRCRSIAMDFVGPLPVDDGYDTILTITDRLGSDIQVIPCKATLTAPELAEIFFDRWYCENGMPDDIVSDRDKLFTSSFWRSLHALTGIKLKCSTSFHPQTDGSSERTNKTVVQALRYFVERSQKGWARALPKVRFAIMNTVNASTGYSPFFLKTGRSPRLFPSLVKATDSPLLDDTLSALSNLQDVVAEAQDALLKAKVDQSSEANKTRADDPRFEVGEKVWLCTRHRRREYMAKGAKRVAKFMPRFDGPYLILDRNLETSTYTLLLPEHSNTHPTFHVAWLKRFVENDAEKWPDRERRRPGPVVTPEGTEEWEVEKILEARKRGRGWQYLVRWAGYGPECDAWLPAREVEECQALDDYEASVEGGLGTTSSSSSADG